MEDGEDGVLKVPLLLERREESSLGSRAWDESKKLWGIVGPAMVTRVSMNTMNTITQAFAGHLGDLELASFSISLSVVGGFSFGLLLGMASALETLCGQAYGAKKYHMLGIYLQRSWIVLFICTILLLPINIFATPILELIGQPTDIAKQAGELSVWFIPMQFSCVLLLPQQRFLQCQNKNLVNAAISVASLVIHIFLSWLLMYKLQMGIVTAVLILNFSWWITVIGQLGYILLGGCPLSWKGFSMEAFSGLWEFIKLSAASGVMLCLENWYYRLLILLAGQLKNAEVAVDALSICINVNNWEFMIPLAFFAGTGVRVANELGAGNGKGARFAAIISVMSSTIIGIFFFALILGFHDEFGLLFTSSNTVLRLVDKLSFLLALSILFNSIQPILSGVAVGSGWQATVAYVNIGSYYFIGVPVGVLLGWILNLQVLGLWVGMIGGTAIQTLILAFLTYKCDWDNEASIAGARVKEWDNVE